jgi:three-Cys-motif partner protein
MTNPDYLRDVPDGLYSLPAGAWAAEKLYYLHHYINMFETSMRVRWPQRNYIDLFAGPGKNIVEGTKQVFLGSPLIALTTCYPFTGYYFVNTDPMETEALKQRCSASPFSDSINIYNGNANQIVDIIVGRIRQYSPKSLNLAFLDPFGLELEWTTVAKLGSLQRCDLLIHYSQQGFSRYIRKAFETETETRIDRFFGTSAWRDIFARWCQAPQKRGLHRELIDFYKERLLSLGYKEDKPPLEKLNEPLIRNKKRNTPLYRLIFASKHPLGQKFWEKIMSRDVYGQTQMFYD